MEVNGEVGEGVPAGPGTVLVGEGQTAADMEEAH